MQKQSPLDNLYIATPCNARWEDMTGDEKKRACSLCAKNVYNISNMSRQEAEDLLLGNEPGSVCVGYFRRSDGTIVTDDCPVGLRRLRNGCRWLLRTAAAAVSLLLSANLFGVGKVWASEFLEGKPLLLSQHKRLVLGSPPSTWKEEFPVSEQKKKGQTISLKEAVSRSPLVVVAEFESIDVNEPVLYTSLPTAKYRVEKVLKGTCVLKEISVRYAFSDFFSRKAPEGWTFCREFLPLAGEKFVLCLSPSITKGFWNTYNGSYGRLDANELNLKAVNSEIAKQSTK